MKHKVDYPFPPSDTATTETAPLTPVQQAVADAKAKHKAAIADAKIAYEQNALDAFERSEQLRREKFIAAWKEDNTWVDFKPRWKYSGWSDEAAVYRDLLEPQHRLQALLDAKLYEQYSKCLLVRHGGTATVKQIQEWLRPYMPVEGDREIRPSDRELARLMKKGHPASLIFAQGISDELYELLVNSYMVSVGLHGRVEFAWRTEHDDQSSW